MFRLVSSVVQWYLVLDQVIFGFNLYFYFIMGKPENSTTRRYLKLRISMFYFVEIVLYQKWNHFLGHFGLTPLYINVKWEPNFYRSCDTDSKWEIRNIAMIDTHLPVSIKLVLKFTFTSLLLHQSCILINSYDPTVGRLQVPPAPTGRTCMDTAIDYYILRKGKKIWVN